jgi:hypothetical protein
MSSSSRILHAKASDLTDFSRYMLRTIVEYDGYGTDVHSTPG